MQDFFSSKENRIYTVLSVLIAVTMLLFIAPQLTLLTLFDFGVSNTLFYLAFLILGILTLGALAYFSRRFDWQKSLSVLLLICLPSALILTYGLSESKNFHYIFILSLGLYVILSGILFSALYITKERLTLTKDPEALSFREWFRAQGLPVLLSVVIATGIFGGFGLHRLTEYAAVDEPLWFDGRIAKYWKNVGERDWRGTNISDKPGITVAIASGPGLFFKSTKDYKTAHVNGEVISLRNDVESFYLAYRLPLLIVITLLLPLFYFFLERLLGKRNALLSYILIATSPILIGMSKIINPDSLLWIFTPLSLIAYLTFLKRHSFRYLIFSGIFLGLALLTKYVSNILFIFFLGLIFLEYLYHPKTTAIAFAEHLKNSLKHLMLLTFTALTAFYLLFPAVWVKPEKLLDGTVLSQAFEKVAPLFVVLIVFILVDQWWNKSRVTSALLSFLEGRTKHVLAVLIALLFLGSLTITVGNAWNHMSFYNASDMLASPKTIADKSDFISVFLTNFYPLAFGVTPFVMLALFVAPFFFLKRNFPDSTSLRAAFYLMIFILLYYIGTTVNNVGAIVRYQIMLFPFAAIIAGITLERILAFGYKKFKKLGTPGPAVAGGVLLVFGAISLLGNPFPLSYANIFLPAQYHIDVKDMGAGSYEAAQYLNTLPDAQNMMIWTDKDGVCKFFMGRCSSAQNYTQLRERGLDYIVASAGRKSRTTKMMSSDITHNKPGLIRFDQYYDRTDPVYEININGRPSHYVKVFKFEE